MVSVDDLIKAHADTNLAWQSSLTRELAEEILEDTLTVDEFQDIIDALDDGVFEIIMSFKK